MNEQQIRRLINEGMDFGANAEIKTVLEACDALRQENARLSAAIEALHKLLPYVKVDLSPNAQIAKLAFEDALQNLQL